MASITCDLVYKVLLLGDTCVGKTCFLLRYTEDTFTENHISTIGVDYKNKILTLGENNLIKLQIWDTAGQDRFRCITKNYLRGSNGIMLIYDITSQSSFTNIKSWISQIAEHLGDQACITLVGNKIDLERNRKVSKEEGLKLAKEYNFNFLETSVKDNININEAFDDLTNEMMKKDENIKRSSRNGTIKISKKEKDNKSRKCC
jgi:small GTP-binding protein